MARYTENMVTRKWWKEKDYIIVSNKANFRFFCSYRSLFSHNNRLFFLNSRIVRSSMDSFPFDMCSSKDIKLTRITANVECHKIMKNEHNGFSVLIYSCFGMYTRRPLDFYVLFFFYVRTTFNGSNIHKSFWQSILLCSLSICFFPLVSFNCARL